MQIQKIALIGNPNTGKTSLFNHLTGLNQQIGNFPGVTVDKKSGLVHLGNGLQADVIDLPGTYSVFPRSRDERVVFDVLSDKKNPDHPDLVLVTVDASNLERNLLLVTQLIDLHLPLIVVLTMGDVARQKQIHTDITRLRDALGNVPVISLNGRTGEGVNDIRTAITQYTVGNETKSFGEVPLRDLLKDEPAQTRDAQQRFQLIRNIAKDVQKGGKKPGIRDIDRKLDKILVHPVLGYVIFVLLLLIIFQVIFNIASFPMDWIDGSFLQFSQWTKEMLPAGVFTNLIAEGIIPGIGGVLVFVPQIALLFFFIALLEDTGYMSRVVFIMDKLVRPFGLNGKSVVPLLSSAACAIPGVMATRNINSWKDRIITIMVAPLMSCSARIPVFTLLIALVIPDKMLFGFINLKGLVLFALYTLGLVSALLVAGVMKYLVKSKEKSFLIMELPAYQLPRWKGVLITLWEKVRIFIVDAGKVILAISIILWALASTGPKERLERETAKVEMPSPNNGITQEEYDKQINAVKLENSYIGIIGHAIEPVIAPLGYDWKIGIALITSFAAREVFVGSMATIYSVGEDFEDDDSLLNRLKEETRPGTLEPVYNLASGVSLMVFYVFAMQCMATFAVVKRETKSWKWPIIQVVYMGVLAYVCAFITYQILS